MISTLELVCMILLCFARQVKQGMCHALAQYNIFAIDISADFVYTQITLR